MSEQNSVLARFPDYRVDIGIEVHVQLTTNTKIFCSCSNEISKAPNSNICFTCTGQPGSLPVLNKAVVEHAILAGLATHCTINPVSEFDRKHYFYPDLPKNFQITQNYKPICSEGYVAIRLEDGSKKNIRLIRIHMEEDAGKNVHGLEGESFVDLNRAGTPLLEIVSYPDIESAFQARAYLHALRSIVQYLGICTGNMEEGAFRADTNISVRKKNDPTLGTKVELKNINSFKFIGDAIEYEIGRQIELLQEGGIVKQETRLWNTKKGISEEMRSKGGSADYRYFSEPDLPRIHIANDIIEGFKKNLPELPDDKFDRLCKTYGLTPYEAAIIIEDNNLAHYFEQAARLTSSKQLINWLLREVVGYLKEHKLTINEFIVTPKKLAELVDLVEAGVINARGGQQVFALIAQTGGEPLSLIKEHNLEQIGSVDDLEKIVLSVLEENQQQVNQYKAGNHKIIGFFAGTIMKKTSGKANPQLIQELLKKHLSK